MEIKKTTALPPANCNKTINQNTSRNSKHKKIRIRQKKLTGKRQLKNRDFSPA